MGNSQSRLGKLKPLSKVLVLGVVYVSVLAAGTAVSQVKRGVDLAAGHLRTAMRRGPREKQPAQ